MTHLRATALLLIGLAAPVHATQFLVMRAHTVGEPALPAFALLPHGQVLRGDEILADLRGDYARSEDILIRTVHERGSYCWSENRADSFFNFAEQFARDIRTAGSDGVFAPLDTVHTTLRDALNTPGTLAYLDLGFQSLPLGASSSFCGANGAVATPPNPTRTPIRTPTGTAPPTPPPPSTPTPTGTSVPTNPAIDTPTPQRTATPERTAPPTCATGNHPADDDRDGAVGDFELLAFIDVWADGGVDDFVLLTVIDHWAAACGDGGFGCYCPDCEYGPIPFRPGACP